MITTFGIHFVMAFQSVVNPTPAPEPVIIDAVVVQVTDSVGGSFQSADITIEEAGNIQTTEDAVICSYTSDGALGTGEEGVTYTFQTGAYEAANLELSCTSTKGN